jgi:hypothetical protein
MDEVVVDDDADEDPLAELLDEKRPFGPSVDCHLFQPLVGLP